LESLKVSGASVFELVNGEVHFFPNNSNQSTAVPLETTTSALHLSHLSNSHVRRFVEWMKSIHCFRIDAYPGQMDERVDREESQPDDELNNLAGWYRHLVQAYPEENVRFLSSMKESLDGFQALRFSSEEDGVKKLRADFMVFAKEKVNYSLSELSEGQRCLLALYMILHFLIARGHTVFIDEPDNFVALREIHPWLLTAEEAIEDQDSGRLILISHHPEILNKWASRHGLRFFREDNGHVRTEKFKGDPAGNLEPSELLARGWEDE
jgi:predicted ATPase